MTIRSRRARKLHRCTTCARPINPGDRHIETTIPPWTLTSDDPEYPPYPLGYWVHMHMHPECAW